MALKDIIETIKKETEGKIEVLKKEKEKEISRLREFYNKEREKKEKEILETAKQEIDQEIAEASWQLIEKRKKQILEKKREILEKIYQKAFEEISNMDEKSYKDFLSKLLKKASEEIREIIGDRLTELEIIPACKRNPPPNFWWGMEKEGTLKVSKHCLNSEGGFIIKTKDIELNCTMETIFEKIKEETELELGQALFLKL